MENAPVAQSRSIRGHSGYIISQHRMSEAGYPTRRRKPLVHFICLFIVVFGLSFIFSGAAFAEILNVSIPPVT